MQNCKFGLLEVVLRYLQDEYRSGPSRLSELHLNLSEFAGKRVGKILVGKIFDKKCVRQHKIHINVILSF